MRNFLELTEDSTMDEIRHSLSKMRIGMVKQVAKLLEIENPRLFKKKRNILAILAHEVKEAIILAHNIVAFERMALRENVNKLPALTKEWVFTKLPVYIEWIARFIALVKSWNLGSLVAELSEQETDEEPAVEPA